MIFQKEQRYQLKKSRNYKGLTLLVQSLLVTVVLIMCYLSVSDIKTQTALAASPEPVRLKPAIKKVREQTLLTSNTKIEDPLTELDLHAESGRIGAVTFPLPELEPIGFSLFKDAPRVQLKKVPAFNSEFGNRYASRSQSNELVYYTLDTELQKFVSSIVAKANAPHVAAVAMDPRTGRVLAIADRSKSIKHLALHAGFPAASLFKVITAAAAVEQANLTVNTKISYRGGTYTLEPWNYLPDLKKDRFSLPLGEALGKSCNPVFGRVALSHLSPAILKDYVKLFGFNRNLESDLPLPTSQAQIPHDGFGFSRTGAGFGDVHISPIHAAAIMSGIANGGILPRPKVVEKVVTQSGSILYEAGNEPLQRIVEPTTASEVMKMMKFTTTTGTSRNEFMRSGKAILKDVEVAGKTGTLRGKDPEGLNTWFIGAAPYNNPQIAVAVIVVNPTAQTKASRIGRLIIEKQLFGTITSVTPIVVKKSYKSYKKSSKKKVVYKKAPVKKSISYAKKSVSSKSATVKIPVKLKPPARK